ncbi:MAG: hypothetical protein IT285_04285, partial [Bdellovibrionales bacterium]|nr:hypothetical protein [Bdellovibrionales bacterium]
MAKASRRQELPPESGAPGVLWVVATPLGNIGDLSPRAREVLAEAERVLCEDTRRTRELFAACGLAAPPLERLDAHARPAEIEAWAHRLAQ